MLDHHLQRSIVYRLAQSESQRFSDLKPSDVESKLFTYHLKKVVAAGLVTKAEDGNYSLTAQGKRLGSRVLETSRAQSSKPHSIYFLIVRRKADGAWLLYRRAVHPLKELAGFMHASPVAEESSVETTNRELFEKTGLSGTFSALGGGYFRMFRAGELESYTNFTLLVCVDATGELRPGHDRAGYEWVMSPDFSANDMLPNMPGLVAAYQAGEPFFFEESYEL